MESLWRKCDAQRILRVRRVLMAAEFVRPSSGKREYLWVERVLYNWANWMFTGGYADFQVRARSVGEGFKHYDSDGEYHKADVDLARITDAVIRDLKRLEREAIEAEYLRREWRNGVSVHTVLVLAHESVRRGLERRGILLT